MSDPGNEGLHIDSDWKAEAERERQKLLEQEQASRGESGQTTDNLFLGILEILAQQAMIAIGGYEGPGGQAIPPDLNAAQQMIKMIESLQAKTKGNTSKEEDKVFNDLLHQLRMVYVQVSQAAGGAGPAGAPGAAQPPM